MLKDLSDSDLLVKLSQCTESEKADIFLTLYERYKLLVLKICYYHLADYDAANDAFHDVFIKMMESVQTIKNPNVFKSWLTATTRNFCVDRLRRTSYLMEQETSAHIEVAIDDKLEDRYIAAIDRQKIREHLTVCVQKLEPVHLNIFKLRWQGLQTKQILEILKMEKADLRRCYDRIKDVLESCMRRKGFDISISEIISLGELDE